MASRVIGIHALFGAFVAGVIMPTNISFRNIFVEKVEDVSLLLLLPLFFVFTGLRTEIDPSIVRDVFKRHEIEASPANFQRFFECYVFWLDFLLCTTEGGICPGVWNFIHALARLPEPPLAGLLTGNIRLGAEIKLRHFQIWENFRFGAYGDDRSAFSNLVPGTKLLRLFT